jgi:hypothetical protein
MRRLARGLFHMGAVLAILSCLDALADDQTRIVPVGSYSSLQQDNEHCKGFSVDLWRGGDSLWGLFRTCAVLTGDIVTSIVSIRSYDRRSGAISFETTLSLGVDYVKGGSEIPSKDHLVFVGTLSESALVGKLQKTDEVYPNHKPKMSSVKLQRRNESLPSFLSYEDWRRRAEELIKDDQPNTK